MALSGTAIVGYAETQIVDRTGKDVWELGAEVMQELMAKTGYEKREIDGLILSFASTGAGELFWSQNTADYLGLELSFCQTVDLGGSSVLGAVARAAAAIEAGLCEVVMLLCADTPVSEDNWKIKRNFFSEWTDPIGLLGPPGAFGLLSKRYEHQFGLDYEMLAKLAVTQREHALLNPLGCEKLRKPMTVDDYLQSRMISDPIRLLDCVRPCEGANGLLITSRRNAEARGIGPFVVPVGYGEHTNYLASDNDADITASGHTIAAARALKTAGLAPNQIESFHPYDDFIIAILLQLEAIGFCSRGQGCDFIRETSFRFDGDLPLNTSGGQISAGQAGGAGGGTNLVEAVRQLMGEGGARQVPRTSNAMVTGIGWIPYGRNWGSSTVLVLQPGA